MQNGFVCRGEADAVIDLLVGRWKEVNPCYTKQQSECVGGYPVYRRDINLPLTATKPEKKIKYLTFPFSLFSEESIDLVECYQTCPAAGVGSVKMKIRMDMGDIGQ